MATPEARKTLNQLVAEESAKAPVVFTGEDKELATVKANHPNASKVYRDERGNIIVRH